MTGQPERTALYRIRDEADLLLYIGITNGIPVRWNGHQAVQPWWDDVCSLTLEWYETRAEAEAAEKAAILAEQPKYNVTYLKPGRWREQRRPEMQPVGWEAVILPPRDDDEDLLNFDDLAKMTRVKEGRLRNVLRNTAGPEGFKIGVEQVFRRGEIRRWIAAIEAVQKTSAAEAPREVA